MTQYLSKDVIVTLDNASGSTARITAYTNSHSLAGALNLLDKSGFGDTTHSFIPGLAGATFTLNGFVNSTTEAIFGPLVGVRTSITKTWGIKRGTKWHKGEAWPGNVQISGSVDNLEVWSCDLTVDGAVTWNTTAPA